MSIPEFPQMGGHATADDPGVSLVSPDWRSEAFPEDLPATARGVWAAEAPRPLLRAVLQCALPLGLALIGGLAAFISVLS